MNMIKGVFVFPYHQNGKSQLPIVSVAISIIRDLLIVINVLHCKLGT